MSKFVLGAVRINARKPVFVSADPIRTLPVSSLPRSVGRGLNDVIVRVAIRKCAMRVWINI